VNGTGEAVEHRASEKRGFVGAKKDGQQKVLLFDYVVLMLETGPSITYSAIWEQEMGSRKGEP
jgi:hypothetical protein